MISPRKPKRINILLALFASCVCATALADYGEQALRANANAQPHFQTSRGREPHRFAHHPNNRYQLYDFYARQARYHLDSSSPRPSLLLPYPGLDGGRRGHWGYTNEKESTAYHRTKGPEYTALTGRDNGRQYVRTGPEDHAAVCLFSFQNGRLDSVLLDATLTAPLHAFALHVDRFGFSLNAHGHAYLKNSAPDWNGTMRYQGYYVHGQQIIFKRTINGYALLDAPRVHYVEGVALLRREIEFLSAAKNLTFTLPDIATPETAGSVLRHSVSCSDGANTVALKAETTAQAYVSIKAVSRNACIWIDTWVQPTNREDILHGLTSTPVAKGVSSRIAGGPQRFPETITMPGTPNADPAVRGGAYDIDDLPVPVENPYNVSMTLSGIDFDDAGIAYVTTLVGDVWRVSGIDRDLKAVTWQRYAAGLNVPLGIEIIDGVPHVITRDQIVALHDLNGNHEADFYERFNTVALPGAGQDRQELQRDAAGNLYYCNNQGIYRVAADGSTVSRAGHGARNPFGLGVRADGLALSDSSEGNQGNGTCTIFESDHAENASSAGAHKRILYLPRGFDNSPGSRLFMNDKRFGPLGSSILGVSYGAGRMYQLLRDANDGTPQAAVVDLPGSFASGTMRLAVNPTDGQVYAVGLDGWGDRAVAEGCISRIRYNGRKAIVPTAWQAHANGIQITFNTPVAPLSAKPFFAQQWNYVDSQHTYGSPEYSVKNPTQIGHDHLPVVSASLLEDQRTVFFEIPTLRPAMCTQLYGEVNAVDGSTLTLNLMGTINRLRGSHPSAAARADSASVLKVPSRAKNGSTPQNLTTFFNRLAGQVDTKRAVAPTVAFKKEDLNYTWINTHILQKQCIMCHTQGMPHDYSSRAGLMTKINLKTPHKSHLYGMLMTDSMPPFPLPTVAPAMKQAMLDWIKMGAPE